MIKLALNFKSRGTEKQTVFPKDLQISNFWKYDTLIITDYKYAEIFKFAMLEIKL